MKHIGKPCTGKPYARFDEGGQGFLFPTLPSVTDPLFSYNFSRTRFTKAILPGSGCGPNGREPIGDTHLFMAAPIIFRFLLK